jgi:hypothetical protein
MNVRSSLFVSVRRCRPAVGLMASAGACAMLCACVGNPFKDAKVDPRSPIAAEVAKSVRADAAYPTFNSIPPVPKDVRPHRQYGQQAAQIEKDAGTLRAETADSTWTLSDSEAFAAKAREDAGPVPPPIEPGATEAFARDQKARATAPPPPPR